MKVVTSNLLPDDEHAVERLYAAMIEAWPAKTDNLGVTRRFAIVPDADTAEAVVKALRNQR
jgi:hypothetical protein